MSLTFRRAGSADAEVLRRSVHAAWRWRHLWDEAAFAENTRPGGRDSYVDDFGSQDGDVGIIAECGDSDAPVACGAAWYRRFTAADHRAGFVDESVPELVIAVFEGHRGEGIGRRLLDELLEVARREGVRRVSLHVDEGNARALRLYRDAGFVAMMSRGGRGVVMIAELSPDAPPGDHPKDT